MTILVLLERLNHSPEFLVHSPFKTNFNTFWLFSWFIQTAPLHSSYQFGEGGWKGMWRVWRKMVQNGFPHTMKVWQFCIKLIRQLRCPFLWRRTVFSKERNLVRSGWSMSCSSRFRSYALLHRSVEFMSWNILWPVSFQECSWFSDSYNWSQEPYKLLRKGGNNDYLRWNAEMYK